MSMPTTLTLRDVGKTFTMHLQGGIRLPVVSGVSLEVGAGECVALGGPSGIGKSSILKMIYGNYACDSGRILLNLPEGQTEIATASARRIIALRRDAIAYVSQFLRVIPRVSALDIVASAAMDGGADAQTATDAARELLAKLNLPERLWRLAPATFSGGEQQRINIARGFVGSHRVLLLDEPTASLDAPNADVVVGLIAAKKASGVAVIGIFHDADVRDRIADRVIDVGRFAQQA